MHYVILRDDDTCALTPPAHLERLYRPFLARGLPVNLAVIPEVRTDVRTPDGRPEGFVVAGRAAVGTLAPLAENRELADYLRNEEGYGIVQHGCHHDPFEFGDSDGAGLARRLDRGAFCFEQAGFSRPAAFVAPHDRLSPAAWLEVVARFEVVSTGWFEARRIPARWWARYGAMKLGHRRHWHAGGAVLLSHPGCLLSFQRPYSEMMAAVQAAVLGSTLTVLVTHWWEYFRGGLPDEPFIGVLHEVAGWLASRADVRVVSFADVAAERVPLN